MGADTQSHHSFKSRSRPRICRWPDWIAQSHAKEGIKSRRLLKFRSKFLVHTQCLHGEGAGSKNPAKRNKAGGGDANDRIFRWVAVPPPDRLPLADPKIPEPQVYRRRVIQKRLKRLGDAYVRPAKLKKQRLAAGIVYKPYKYGDPEKLKAAKSFFERRAMILRELLVSALRRKLPRLCCQIEKVGIFTVYSSLRTKEWMRRSYEWELVSSLWFFREAWLILLAGRKLEHLNTQKLPVFRSFFISQFSFPFLLKFVPISDTLRRQTI
ncbi:uncharacterized protein LOC112350891 [Selaginella moellendorffii]|uniref:uncharacterized protein LOC112350891 n=1 Tax=Selaginella moellendorffii TaxID=88036 RepID=UPI000D1C63AA|nr:uncharacterized protein LOC112350891 [Selaginella moellendorffii]|eukprot:XP_024543643.1 uncharacterized protein LOC112350891 [Selaginella moellendorffii]